MPEQFFSDADLTSFEYRIYFAGEFNAGGVVKKRLKTEEEIWKEEQFKINKGKKRKKDEEVPKEELMKLAYFEDLAQKDAERLEKLGVKERFFDVMEDNYKSNLLEWILPTPEI